ncbi:MAG: malto-oligosyltrehalose trehalohydrolase [Steroidobacteraceae bacterium]
MKRCHRMPFGTQINADGTTRFRLWAPTARRVQLITDVADSELLELQQRGNGWYEITAAVTTGTMYQYRIDDELNVPDPAARFNPQGVHRQSELIDPAAFDWQDMHWQGRPWHEAVIYELHVGTFTRAGTFDAARLRLKELAAMGITAIELMPVNAFSGKHGWGYDGVLPYAPHASYGRPESFKEFVQAAHACGLMVLLDVVYNHFGPDGNYLHRYAGSFFTDRVHTPWGSAIEFEGDAGRVVRDYFIHNALYWLEEFHLDGLRLDAVHAMHDRSELHFIDELSQAVQRGPGARRPVHLVLENHENQSSHLQRGPNGEISLATAQWNDDFHHALHVILTGERDGYYIDFAQRPIEQLGRTLAQGFAFQGEPSQFADGRLRGEYSAALPPGAFVNFLQTHDQVGNRALGERMAQLTTPEALRAGLALLLLAPQIPMLFMGEEYAADEPFLYFCDYHGDLGRAVTAGRRHEFARFKAFAGADAQATIPDPCDRKTLTASRLAWAMRRKSPHRELLKYIRTLLRLRARELVPMIPHLRNNSATFRLIGTTILAVNWPADNGAEWMLRANLSGRASADPIVMRGRSVFDTHQPVAGQLQPWQVRCLRRGD